MYLPYRFKPRACSGRGLPSQVKGARLRALSRRSSSVQIAPLALIFPAFLQSRWLRIFKAEKETDTPCSVRKSLCQRLVTLPASCLKLFPLVGVLLRPLQDRVNDPIP
jgi:hypothetical protein